MTPAMAATTGTIDVSIVDGTRQPLESNANLLLRVLDGRKQQVVTTWLKGSDIRITELPFHDNLDDLYTVIIHGGGYNDAGIYPIRLKAGRKVDNYAMLLPNDGAFHFPPIAQLQQDPHLYQLISNGIAPADVEDRYHSSVEDQPMELGALLSLGTAIRDIPLDDQSSPLQYYWEVRRDLIAQDRFYAWVDARLVARIKKLADLHSFAEEEDAAHWHPGIPGVIQPATQSWKQTRFDVANVQLTFHENDTKTVTTPSGEEVACVIVEPDMDYYKDLIAHGLLEVLPNLITKGKTDPRQAYSLRWMATRLEGLPEFSPPCTIE